MVEILMLLVKWWLELNYTSQFLVCALGVGTLLLLGVLFYSGVSGTVLGVHRLKLRRAEVERDSVQYQIRAQNEGALTPDVRTQMSRAEVESFRMRTIKEIELARLNHDQNLQGTIWKEWSKVELARLQTIREGLDPETASVLTPTVMPYPPLEGGGKLPQELVEAHQEVDDFMARLKGN